MSTKSNGSGVTTPDFTQGLGGMASGSNSSGFTMGDSGVGSMSGGPQPMAGLTGISSGMGDFTGGTPSTLTTGTEQYQFALPTGSSSGGAGGSLGMGSPMAQLPSGQQPIRQGNAGRVLHPQNFTTGMIDGTTAQGTSAGNGLLQLLQKYQVGR